MDARAAAELKTLLVGVPLPAEKAELLEYAVRQRAEPSLLAPLRRVADRQYASLDEVVEELLHVQPPHEHDRHRPREESGAPPGGDEYR